jgi:hypothetical protein
MIVGENIIFHFQNEFFLEISFIFWYPSFFKEKNNFCDFMFVINAIITQKFCFLMHLKVCSKRKKQ